MSGSTGDASSATTTKETLEPSNTPASTTTATTSEKMQPATSQPEAQAPDNAQSMFSGWGFDVKAVTDNMGIGGLFASPDSLDPERVEVGELDPAAQHVTTTNANPAVDNISATADELGAKAAHLASTATTELGNASKAAQETIGKAAEEIGRGWGNLNNLLDDMLAPDKKTSTAADPDENVDVHAKFRELFPEQPPDDEVVDHYRCILLQKYRCYLNNSTPEKTFPLRGRLFVTTAMIAMYVADDGGAFGGQQFGVSIPFQDVAKIQKGAKSMLRVVTKSQTSFIFADFESDTHYSGALSLLEHMTGASAPVPGSVSTPQPSKAPAPGSEDTPVAD